ncbi:hypothetical protein ONZ51_g3250 [Trametes cubensis]|uniref:Uncharacterized protein n=1 Tax=Trametes cubensis TaxID=1111947 RepID=A0AAD7U0G5_9APHY|nr:hypothetical protein ONZ51_g3250 [Trametes cubensis]
MKRDRRPSLRSGQPASQPPAPEPSRTCENVRPEGGGVQSTDAAPIQTSASASARRGSKAPTCGGGSDRRGPPSLPRRHGVREDDENRVVRSPAGFLVERGRADVERPHPRSRSLEDQEEHEMIAPAGMGQCPRAMASSLAVHDERRRSSGEALPHRSSRMHRTLSARRGVTGVLVCAPGAGRFHRWAAEASDVPRGRVAGRTKPQAGLP